MATDQRYVNTASSGTGDGTSNATSGANAAYASLASWEANSGGSATNDYIVDCCGSIDTTAVNIDFPTDITTGSILVRTNASDPNGKYNGTQCISTNHYLLAPTGSVSALTISESNVTIDGLQIECQGGAFRAGIMIAGLKSVGTYAIRNCHIRASGACDVGIGSGNANIATNGSMVMENNLVVGFNLQGIEWLTDNFRTPTVTIRHNTVYGDGSSVLIKVFNASSNAGATYSIRANALANSGASNCFDVTTTGGGTVTYQQNATEDAQGTTGEIAIGTLANAWVNPGTGRTADFAVKDASSPLYNAVNPTLITTDITGYLRDGSNHDIGAFELQGAGGPVPPIPPVNLFLSQAAGRASYH